MTSTAFVAAAPCAPQLSRPSLLARRPRREITGRRSAPRAVLPALAAEAASVAADSARAAADAATVAAADAAAAASDAAAGMSTEDFGNAGPQRWLATLAFFLVAYLTLGVLVLSWDEWRKKRNSEREIEEWRAAGGAKRKWGATGRADASDAGLNRESRRMAKKREAREKREKRKK